MVEPGKTKISVMYFDASPELINLAKEMRKNMTQSEKTLWEKLRRNSFNLRFRRQHPINNYIADFYCHEIRLVIEVDGPIHLMEANYRKDKNRTAEMERYGITVLRFTNDEVLNGINEVLKKIRMEVNSLRRNSG